MRYADRKEVSYQILSSRKYEISQNEQLIMWQDDRNNMQES